MMKGPFSNKMPAGFDFVCDACNQARPEHEAHFEAGEDFFVCELCHDEWNEDLEAEVDHS